MGNHLMWGSSCCLKAAWDWEVRYRWQYAAQPWRFWQKAGEDWTKLGGWAREQWGNLEAHMWHNRKWGCAADSTLKIINRFRRYMSEQGKVHISLWYLSLINHEDENGELHLACPKLDSKCQFLARHLQIRFGPFHFQWTSFSTLMPVPARLSLKVGENLLPIRLFLP